MGASTCNDEFKKWAGRHGYLPIVERDFRAVWDAAWSACLDCVDAELDPRVNLRTRDLIQDAINPSVPYSTSHKP